MWIEFLTVSGVLFWVLVLAFIVLETSLVTYEAFGKSAFFLIAAIAAVLLFTDALHGVSLVWLIVAVPLYILAGILWAIKKWKEKLDVARGTARAAYDKSDKKKSFLRYADDSGLRPLAADSKALLTGWMMTWPFSVMAWITILPRRAFRAIIEHMSTFFERMSKRNFEKN